MSASSKRRATSDLNHDNWDRESEPETMGTFQTAPEGELKNRVIRKAVRKLAGTVDSTNKSDDSADGGTKSVFSGFSGFGKTPSTATTASPFSSISSNESTKKSEETKTSSNTFSFLTKFASSTPSTPANDVKTDSAKNNSTTLEKAPEKPSSNSDNFNFEKSTDYYAKLKGLNQAVSLWIKTHVDKNPLCLLTPIFKDYEKYLAEISKSEETSATKSVDGAAASQAQVMNNFKFQTSSSTFSFGKKPTDDTDSAPEPKKTSIFGNSAKSPEEKPTNTMTTFSFGGAAKTDAPSATTFSLPSTGFSFGGAKPFSFGNIQPPPASTEKTANADDNENGDEDDEPPKVEFKAVVEEDSVYSKRCKVFVKNDGNFTDRGVGTVFLKPVKDSTKTQLLVRADTNLGNILVNLILNESIPTQRMGKNNVMLVCIPTPDVEKPTPMLLRVKTSEEADELLETIDKYKKK